MSWTNDTYLVGENVKISSTSRYGVVTRIVWSKKPVLEKNERGEGLIYVLFKGGTELYFAYPEDVDNKEVVLINSDIIKTKDKFKDDYEIYKQRVEEKRQKSLETQVVEETPTKKKGSKKTTEEPSK